MTQLIFFCVKRGTEQSPNRYRAMRPQPKHTMRSADPVYPPDTGVLGQGFRRAFPVDDACPFNDLLVAIDIAEEQRQKR